MFVGLRLLRHELLYPLTPGVNHVDRSIRPNGDVRCQTELAVVVSEPAKAVYDPAVPVEDHHAGAIRRFGRLVTTVRDIDFPVNTQGNCIRTPQVGAPPCCEKSSAGIKHLESRVA